MIRCCIGGPFHAISGSSVFHKEYDRMTFRGFVQICCLVNVVLQNLALPMDWTSGFARGAPSCSVRTPLAGCGARTGMPAIRGLKGQCTTLTLRRYHGMALDPWGQHVLIFWMYDSETMR